eukprot:6997100-Alexandrium_andersonii.AAC.1
MRTTYAKRRCHHTCIVRCSVVALKRKPPKVHPFGAQKPCRPARPWPWRPVKRPARCWRRPLAPEPPAGSGAPPQAGLAAGAAR